MINKILVGTKRAVMLGLLLAGSGQAGPKDNLLDRPQMLDNYSFDFSAHQLPRAYETFGAAVQLHHEIKLIPDVKDRYGAIVMKKVSGGCWR